MPYDFRYTTEQEYLDELATLLRNDCSNKNDQPEYEELMNEFMEFYEVSGSGK